VTHAADLLINKTNCNLCILKTLSLGSSVLGYSLPIFV